MFCVNFFHCCYLINFTESFMWLKMLYVYLCVCFSIQPSQNLSLISSHLSLNCKGCWGTTDDFTTSWYGMVACIHHLVSGVQSTTWQSPSLSRLNTWPSSSSWNPSAHLALFFKLWSYPPSDVVLAPAISPITGRLMEGRSVLFLPAHVQRTCPLPTNICVLCICAYIVLSRTQGKQVLTYTDKCH